MGGHMLMHVDGSEALLKDLQAVPVPEKTKSYQPVPYDVAVMAVEKRAVEELGREVKTRQFGLSHNGAQMFGVLTFDMEVNETGLSIGIRQSYDKTVALGLCCGANVFVCDNLVFDGSSIRVVRRNTLNVWDDFKMLIDDALEHALQDYHNILGDALVLKAVPCPERVGAEIIGLAQYQSVLRPQQANVAFGDWRTPRYPAFTKRNLWSLYNCFTQGLKRTPAGATMESFAGTHKFFRDRIAELPDEMMDRAMQLVEKGQEAHAA